MKIIAFAGSNSKISINKALASHATTLFKNATVEILDLNDFEMPIFSVDLENQLGKLSQAQAFLDKIAEADFVVVSLAEHNGSYASVFKNIFDWCSRINPKVFQQKPMLLMATSPGARGGKSVLELAENAFPRYGAIIKGTFSLPNFNDNFDIEKGVISNNDFDSELNKVIQNCMV